jgi:hypothetical protein
LAIAGSIFILVRLSTSHGNGYIVACRDCSNPSALNKFVNGSVVDLLSFVGFAALIFAIHTILSLRVYHVHRQLSVTILSLGLLLLTLTIIVSNALLVLR